MLAFYLFTYIVGSNSFSLTIISSVSPRHEALTDIPGSFIMQIFILCYVKMPRTCCLSLCCFRRFFVCFSSDWEAYLLLMLWLLSIIFWTGIVDLDLLVFPEQGGCFVKRALLPQDKQCLPSAGYGQALCFVPRTQDLRQNCDLSSSSLVLLVLLGSAAAAERAASGQKPLSCSFGLDVFLTNGVSSFLLNLFLL